MKQIPYGKPSISSLEVEYVNDALLNGWGANSINYIRKFELAFRNYLGSSYSLSTSSCTGALHLALAALGIKEGDEVIVPDATWIASVTPILFMGAKPVLVDVLEDSWCIDPQKVREAITPKTKAIIVVHLYGNLVEMDEIMQIAHEHNLKVIEDSAESLGSEYKGKKAGSIGDFGVFSFHSVKTCSTGEGGMLVTNNEELFNEAVILGDHGRDPKIGKTFWMDRVGYKYRMSNLQAAMGLAQIKRADEFVKKRREIFNWYKELFSNIEGISFNPEQDYTKNSYWMPTIIFNQTLNVNRDELLRFLNDYNISARPFFYPVSSLKMFEDKKSNVVSYSVSGRGINLPSYYDLTKEDAEYVSDKVKEFIVKSKEGIKKMEKANENNYTHMCSLREYVSVKKNKNVEELNKAALQWMKVREENKLDYELDWLGVPIIQAPEDLALMQELIYKINPDVIVEVGIAHGGSLIFYSSLFEIFNKNGRVVGVDIEIREHNKKVLEQHPLFGRIKLIEGSSVLPEIFERAKKEIPFGSKTLVCLDSNHTKEHVLKELRMYSSLVNVGSYFVVFDSNSSQLAELGAADPIYINNGPLAAIKEFLREDDRFVIDEEYNKLYISSNPNGFLKRIK